MCRLVCPFRKYVESFHGPIGIRLGNVSESVNPRQTRYSEAGKENLRDQSIQKLKSHPLKQPQG